MKDRCPTIAVSARGLHIHFGGILAYHQMLLPELVRTADGRCRFELFFNGAPPSSETIDGSFAGAGLHGSSRAVHPVIWDHLVVSGKMRSIGADVCFFPKGQMPMGKVPPSVITIHDLGYFEHGNRHYPLADTIYQRWILRRSVRKAARIIAISTATKKAIIRHTGIAAEKISVVHHGIMPAPGEKEINSGWNHLHSRLGLTSENYIVIPKGDAFRKNTPRALKAFLKSSVGKQFKLVITGTFKQKSEVLKRAEQAFPAVVPAGIVTKAEMMALYRHAACCLYPSLYEGFGLPILEAMQQGCPVATSNCSSMPEIAGDAAVYFNPLHVDDIAEAIDSIVLNKNVAAELRQKGDRNLRRFRMRDMVEKTMKVLTQTAQF